MSVTQKRNIALALVLWWLATMLMHSMALHYYGVNWFTSVVNSFLCTTLLEIVLAISLVAIRYYPLSLNKWYNSIIWSISLSGLWLYSLQYIPYDNAYEQVMVLLLPFRALLGFSMVLISVLASWIFYLYEDKWRTESHQETLIKSAKDAEMSNLRQQLQPHFLFNSLNSINALIGTKPEQARNMLQQLSDFLRTTVSLNALQTISLKEELEHLQLYLNIEQVRFGHRLHTQLTSAEENNTIQLPALVLQPIVENAIKYGLYGTTDEVLIQIHSQIQANELIINIKNPFDADAASTHKGTGFGLNAVRRRLFLTYGNSQLLRTYTSEGIFTTEITIPIVNKG